MSKSVIIKSIEGRPNTNVYGFPETESVQISFGVGTWPSRTDLTLTFSPAEARQLGIDLVAISDEMAAIIKNEMAANEPNDLAPLEPPDRTPENQEFHDKLLPDDHDEIQF